MSYDISFRVKVEGTDRYLDTGYCDANITWNVRENHHPFHRPALGERGQQRFREGHHPLYSERPVRTAKKRPGV